MAGASGPKSVRRSAAIGVGKESISPGSCTLSTVTCQGWSGKDPPPPLCARRVILRRRRVLRRVLPLLFLYGICTKKRWDYYTVPTAFLPPPFFSWTVSMSVTPGSFIYTSFFPRTSAIFCSFFLFSVISFFSRLPLSWQIIGFSPCATNAARIASSVSGISMTTFDVSSGIIIPDRGVRLVTLYSIKSDDGISCSAYKGVRNAAVVASGQLAGLCPYIAHIPQYCALRKGHTSTV